MLPPEGITTFLVRSSPCPPVSDLSCLAFFS